MEDKRMCCGCGTCAGVCPNGAVEMAVDAGGFYHPRVDVKRCAGCGLCKRVCPQSGSRGGSATGPEALLGSHIGCYLGRSTDEELRANSSSGGAATQYLVCALEEGLIDGALVTRMGGKNPLTPETFIARTGRELMAASGSKYCPVAANAAFSELMGSAGRYAVVGLPCHIRGARLAEAAIPKLAERISLRCGLFCGGTRSFHGTGYLLHRYGFGGEDVTELRYRGGGWPGNLVIKAGGAGESRIPYHPGYGSTMFGKVFRSRACNSCRDYTNELADISFGDPWGMENEGAGRSLIITRSQTADGFLRSLRSRGALEAVEVSAGDVAASANAFRLKKKLPLRASRVFEYSKADFSEMAWAVSPLNACSISDARLVRESALRAMDLWVSFFSMLGGRRDGG
jgi:coenzyme F420 hydrogenase subunit beta